MYINQISAIPITIAIPSVSSLFQAPFSSFHSDPGFLWHARWRGLWNSGLLARTGLRTFRYVCLACEIFFHSFLRQDVLENGQLRCWIPLIGRLCVCMGRYVLRRGSNVKLERREAQPQPGKAADLIKETPVANSRICFTCIFAGAA